MITDTHGQDARATTVGETPPILLQRLAASSANGVRHARMRRLCVTKIYSSGVRIMLTLNNWSRTVWWMSRRATQVGPGKRGRPGLTKIGEESPCPDRVVTIACIPFAIWSCGVDGVSGRVTGGSLRQSSPVARPVARRLRRPLPQLPPQAQAARRRQRPDDPARRRLLRLRRRRRLRMAQPVELASDQRVRRPAGQRQIGSSCTVRSCSRPRGWSWTISMPTGPTTVGSISASVPPGESRNQRKRHGSARRFKGVYYHKRARKWYAEMSVRREETSVSALSTTRWTPPVPTTVRRSNITASSPT